MSEWNSVIPVIGTLSGLLIGYWISSRIEAKKENHAEKMYYRNKLTEHMDDIIIPLYGLVEELWRSLSFLKESVSGKQINEEMKKDALQRVQRAQNALAEFYSLKKIQILIDMLLPYSLETWIFFPLKLEIDAIIVLINLGQKPIDKMTKVIDAFMKYQENLKKLIGYETKVKLYDVYPLTSKK